ncbi:MAG: flavodoxin-dependent (E)-4-hydroxy-3-methylbut-2-enyl-diphosphate synthase [Actinomycetes bacterium]|jgi:(E)-4-hydroxy-3-methylbut-2-enyl-diphosphate synthase|nr:flavodoxin-dependent (E)-4-hydroxy-3-methylbut-2-enyl-diphosphate synthase [Actinomycetes bacterium]
MAGTRQITVGDVALGGGAPVVVQSMLSVDTCDLNAAMSQITALADAGCELVRIAIPHASALDAFAELCRFSPVPVIADIHFDYRLALAAAERGAAKLRINPGNLGGIDRFDAVLDAAGERDVALRIGVNAGSLDATVAARRDLDLPGKLVESALSYQRHAVSRGFDRLVLSVKASSVPVTVAAYRALAAQSDFPLHVGVTEAGTELRGTVKSAVGLGALLLDGIGDTLRVSLTADPVAEVGVAWRILEACDLRRREPELISCPTCGRCEVDMIPIADEVQRRLTELAAREPAAAALKVAVMGCVVNGPGEAREADYGIACGRDVGMLFAHGKPVRKVPARDLVPALFDLMAEIA